MCYFVNLISFGLPTVIISVLTGFIFFIIVKFLIKKNRKYFTYLPFVFGAILYYAYECFFNGASFYDAEVLSLSAVCGSLSISFYTLLYKRKIKTLDEETEEILKTLGIENVSEIKNSVKLVFDKDAKVTEDTLITELKKYLNGTVSDEAIKSAATLLKNIFSDDKTRKGK